MNNDNEKAKVRFFNRIFYNNKYLLLFSIILAVIIWASVVMEFSPESEYVISGVPVKISEKNSGVSATGLRPFGIEDLTVDVTIVGPRYSTKISDITPDDFLVEAVVTNDISSVGEHELNLEYSVTDKRAQYTIKSISKQSVLVYFDNYTKEKSVEIELTGIPKSELAKEGLFCEGVILSPSTVTVSGATSQINSLGDKIKASFDSSNLSFPLSETVSFDVNLILQDSDGKRLNYITVVDGDDITGTIPVLNIKELKTTVSFKNIPNSTESGIPSNVSYTISPETVEAAATKDVLDTMDSLGVGVIDFKDLTSGSNTFVFKKDDVTSAKIPDKNVDEFTVTVNVKDVTTKKINLDSDNIKIKGIPDGYRDVTPKEELKLENVVLVGPSSTLDTIDEETITEEDISVTVNLDTLTEVKEGGNEVTATITVNRNGVWANGEYKLIVKLEKV